MSTFTDILGGGTAIANLLGGLFGANEEDLTNVNPFTQQIMQQLQDAISTGNIDQSQLQALANQSQGRASDAARNAQSTGNEIKNLSQPGANDWWEQWEQNVPEYQQIALNFADEATTDLGASLQDQARLQTSEALSAVANQFGGSSFSGAASKAAGKGAALPIAGAQAQLQGARSQLAGNTFNNLAGAGQQISAQSVQNQFENALSALSTSMQGDLGAADIFTTQGSSFQGGANSQGNQITSLLASLGAMGTPQIQAPTYTESPFAKLASGLNSGFNIFSTLDNNSTIDDILKAIRGE